jgi:subtilisin family serine protease
MHLLEIINSNDLQNLDSCYYTLNGRMIMPNTTIPKNSIIEQHYRLRGGATTYVETDTDLTSALTTEQTIQVKKGTYTGNFSFSSNSSSTLEILGGYTSLNTYDSSSSTNDTIINGNLTLTSSGDISLKNFKVTGTIKVNGAIILLENLNNTEFGQVEGTNVQFNAGTFNFNDFFIIGESELLGNIIVITNGIHFTKKLTCSSYAIDIQKTGDNTQPIEATLTNPTDFYYLDQYALNTSKVNDAWKYCDFTKTTEVVVAVLDTGVDLDHPDLINNLYKDGNGNIIGRRYFNGGSNDDSYDDDHGHGTHVSGIIAAECDNNIGVAGVSRNDKIKIMPIKVLNQYDDGYYGYNSDIALGIRWAVDNGAHIINMSLGGPSSDSSTSSSIQYAIDNGVLVVAAAGNSDYNSFVEYPGADTNALCVGAIEEDLDIASFSSYKVDATYPNKPENHLGVDLVSPGVSIVSTYDNNTTSTDTYYTMSGTSMATPLMAGIAALLMQQCSNYLGKPDIVRKVLLQSSTDLGDSGYDDRFGYGMVDTKSALLYPWSSTFYDTDNSNQVTSASDYSFTRLTQATVNTIYTDAPSNNTDSKKKSKKGLGLLLGVLLAGSLALSSLSGNESEKDLEVA